MSWSCFHNCGWFQQADHPEPPFTPHKMCEGDCDCWSHQCPKCGAAVNHSPNIRNIDIDCISITPENSANPGMADVVEELLFPSEVPMEYQHPKDQIKHILSGTRKDRIGRDPLANLNQSQEKLLDDIIQRKSLRSFCFAAPIKTYDLHNVRLPDLLELSSLKLLYMKGAALASIGISFRHRLIMEDLTGSLIYTSCDTIDPAVIPAYCAALQEANALLADSYGTNYVSIEMESDLLESFSPGYRQQHLKDFLEFSDLIYHAGQDIIMLNQSPDMSAYMLPTFNWAGFTYDSLTHYQERLVQNQRVKDSLHVICDFFLCAMLRHRYGFAKVSDQVDMKIAFSSNPHMPQQEVGIPPVICRSNWFQSRHKENNLPFWAGVSVFDDVTFKKVPTINAYPVRMLPEGTSQVEIAIQSGETKCLLTPYVKNI